jgi:hypothetical protein
MYSDCHVATAKGLRVVAQSLICSAESLRICCDAK